ncbi:hypothetical protein BJX76DRAFT_329659 [Aspergillus varians]
MFFNTALIATTLAMATSALPNPAPSGTSTSTSSGASSSPSASSGTSSGGGGGVQIINNLDTTVQLSSTGSEAGANQELTSGGGTYSAKWEENSNGGGMSLKMSTSEGDNSVLQFEYTTSGDKLFWDLSCIDLNENSPFITGGFSASSDDSSCKSVTCEAGDTNCQAAYQNPDDVATNSCSLDSTFTVTLG